MEFAGGKLVGVKPAGLPAGTTISVADFFYCVPARRKFLKSDTTELGHIASLGDALRAGESRTNISSLTTPTQEIINCPPAEKLADRVYQLFGRQALDELVEIPATSAPFRAAITEPELEPGEEATTLTVTGFTSRPEIQRPNRNGIYIFVNRRLVRDRLILHAIHEAYRNILPPTVFPATLLFLEMPYDEVDVNVHPAKIEVRFRRSQFVHDFTRDAIRQALMSARPIASFADCWRQQCAAIPPRLLRPFPEDFTGSNGKFRRAARDHSCDGRDRRGLGRRIGFASGAGFDLTSAPLQPVPAAISVCSWALRLRPGAAQRDCTGPRSTGQRISRAEAQDAPATLAAPRTNCRPEAAGTSQFEFYCGGKRRRAVDRGSARGARTRAFRAAPGSAARRKSGSASAC